MTGTPIVDPQTGPPMTEAEYLAALASLDAERAALVYEYTTSQTYPRWAYHATEPAQLVDSDEEALALGEGWSATPVGDAPRPVLTALVPDTVAIGEPSFTLHVHGTGFALDAVIVFNGFDEPTTVVSTTEVTTVVNMTVWTAPSAPLPVTVRQGVVVSHALPFTFLPAPPLRSAADPGPALGWPVRPPVPADRG
jgi:hypothetical protein